MKDLVVAQKLGIDVSDIVTVTHPDKTARGKRRVFQMPYLAFVKRDLKDRGFEIQGQAVPSNEPKSYRERELEAEVERLRRQVAQNATADEDDRRAELLAEAEALGVKVHPNAKNETIETKLAAARAVSANASDEDFD